MIIPLLFSTPASPRFGFRASDGFSADAPRSAGVVVLRKDKGMFIRSTDAGGNSW